MTELLRSLALRADTVVASMLKLPWGVGGPPLLGALPSLLQDPGPARRAPQMDIAARLPLLILPAGLPQQTRPVLVPVQAASRPKVIGNGTARASAAAAAAAAALHLRRRRQQRVRRRAQGGKAGGGANDEDEDEFDDENFSLVDMLIQKSRSASEFGISTSDWDEDFVEEVPEGFQESLRSGLDLVDARAGTWAVRLLAESEEDVPRYTLRLIPRPTFGLGLILNKQLVHSFTILRPLEENLKRLGVGYVETLTLHSEGGRMNFPFWVYDAVAEAYRQGLCTRVGVSHASARPRDLQEVAKALQARGVALSSMIFRLSLLNRSSLPLIQECKNLGVQAYASDPLGPDELASGRYTAANPTGGEVTLPRFSLAQLAPLRELHEALASVAGRVRRRLNEQDLEPAFPISTTQVALQWVRSKGASPLCSVSSKANAEAVIGCKGWELTAPEVEQLDKAAQAVKMRTH